MAIEGSIRVVVLYYLRSVVNVFKCVLNRLRRRIMHFRLQAIRVFLFHQVSDIYEPEICNSCDWIQTEHFKQLINELNKHYTFISLTQAVEHLSRDYFRLKKYAVLTSDDGAASLKDIFPWIKEQGVPITLFINGKYLDGKSFRDRPSERYLTREELFALDDEDIEIGHHGWEHHDMTQLTQEDCLKSIEKNCSLLRTHSRYVPFWAYTWGRHNEELDSYLFSKGITPVLIDGMRNYNNPHLIHRELLDGITVNDDIS